MSEITFPGVASATVAIFGLNAAFVVGTHAWPQPERSYVVSQNLPSTSLFERATGVETIEHFAAEIASVYAALSDTQGPLGSEFEAVWDANVDHLYES